MSMWTAVSDYDYYAESGLYGDDFDEPELDEPEFDDPQAEADDPQAEEYYEAAAPPILWGAEFTDAPPDLAGSIARIGARFETIANLLKGVA